jgi:sulfur relay (sulfurtransferase) DsrF/TusC family protein
MTEKNILVIVKSRPYTTLNYYEALRVAIGLWEHEVTLLWMSDGIYSLLKEADQAMMAHFHGDFPDLDIETYVEKAALEARNLSLEDLIPGVNLADENKVADLLLEAEASLVF